MIVPFLESFLDLDEQKSHASAIFIILCFTIISLFFYGKREHLNYSLTLWVSVGGVIGGFLGAKLLPKLSSASIHKIFGFFMILAAVRMVVAA